VESHDESRGQSHGESRGEASGESRGESHGESRGKASGEPTPRLTETSYIVLGLLQLAGQATPYDLKRVAQMTTSNFWSIPHTQLYTECARLAREGLLDERQEQTGRRRRIYQLSARGSEMLARWRNEPTSALYELRDASTLKLFFGGDPAVLAASQLEAHRRQLEVYERLHASLADAALGQRLALECGIGHEREFIRFWASVSETDPPAADA
jgi:PadR family transcriptional regulator, regulatory protein AphA